MFDYSLNLGIGLFDSFLQQVLDIVDDFHFLL